MNKNRAGSEVRFWVHDSDGFVLVAALMFLAILSVVGLSASNDMQVEMLISKNDRLAKEVFYGSEGGLSLGMNVAIENLACVKGFSSNITDRDSRVIQRVEIVDRDFAFQEPPSLTMFPTDDTDVIDMTIPRLNEDGSFSEIHNNMTVFGSLWLGSGSSIPIASGYDENGYSFASSAVFRLDVVSQQFGLENSVSVLTQRYDEKVSTVKNCKYDSLRQ